MTIRFLSYGESLVDFLPAKRGPLRDVDTFTKTLGGAPTNASVGLARLGCDVALLGMVGSNEFGQYVAQKLAEEGVDSSTVMHTNKAKTGITFVTLNESGDRSFLFFREPSADLTISHHDINESAFEGRDVLLLGSNLLTEEPARSATKKVLEIAHERGMAIAMDVNYRAHLWSDVETARLHISDAVKRCHLIKVNEEERDFLREVFETDALYDTLKQHGLKTLIVTLAENGAEAFTAHGRATATPPKVEVVDTTGAGDGFIAATLTALSSSGEDFKTQLDSLSLDQWEKVLTGACYVGSMVCTQLGATPALPRLEELPEGTLTVSS